MRGLKIVVRKDMRRLEVYRDDAFQKAYHVVFGRAPVGPKRHSGDSRTPEGRYYICTKSNESRFDYFMGLSYPNLEDARIALRKSLISSTQFDRIRWAITRGGKPPWNTPLGGAIGIHGEGKYEDFVKKHGIDFTDGCIAMNTVEMREIFRLAPIGTPVHIKR